MLNASSPTPAPRSAIWMPIFAGLCASLVSIGLAVTANLAATGYTQKYGSQDVAKALEAAGAKPTDTVYVLGDYAYDLPFYRKADKPMVVVQDWVELRKQVSDDWQHELMEGAAFDPPAASVLQGPEVLVQARTQPNTWVVGRHDTPLEGFAQVFKGRAWSLYQSTDAAALAPESPKTTQ